MNVAIYARVSTADQTCENQLIELRRYCAARAWAPQEFVDQGVSGARETRPALDAMLIAVKRRQVDAVVVWRLDRLGRNLRHLILMLDELHAMGVSFVSLGEGIDTSTPAGRLQLHILGAMAEFERARIAERVIIGLARARAQGQRLGRPRRRVTEIEIESTSGLSVRQAPACLGYRRVSSPSGGCPETLPHQASHPAGCAPNSFGPLAVQNHRIADRSPVPVP